MKRGIPAIRKVIQAEKMGCMRDVGYFGRLTEGPRQAYTREVRVMLQKMKP